MENTALDYFLEVCATGSIGKAGKVLRVTPQAVSKAITGLEKKLGYPLLIRTRDGCVPTQRGLEVQRAGIRLQRFQQQTMDLIYGIDRNSGERQEVHIGVWGAFASIMPVSDYADFHALYPEIQLCMHSYADLTACETALINGEVELAFCGHGENEDRYTCLQEYGSAPYIMVNGKNRLASKGKIQLTELASEKLIADYSADGHRLDFQDEIEKANLAPALILPPLSDPLKRTLVLQENYVAFSYCPPGWLPYGIVPILVSDLRRYEATFFSKANGRDLSEAAQKYADYIVPRFKKDIFAM